MKTDSQFIVKDGMRFEVRPFDNDEFLVRRYELGGKTWSSFISTNKNSKLTVEDVISRYIERLNQPSRPSGLSKLITSAINGK